MMDLDANRLQAIEALMKEFVRPDGPGFALGLVASGEERFFTSGLASIEHRAPITRDTLFHVASISKQFTAYAAARLAHEGRLDLDGDIRKYLPYVPEFGEKITTRDLIQHTSGLSDQWDLFALSGRSFSDRLTQRQILSMVERQTRLAFAPRTAFRYCNTGYSLAAEIVAKLTGVSFARYCADAIFAPAGMKSSLFPEKAGTLVYGRAQSYQCEEDGWSHALLNFENYGATSLLSSITDLAAWARFLLAKPSDDPLGLDALGSPGTLKDGSRFRYGFGLTSAPLAGEKTFAHTGVDAGYRACTAYFPQKQCAIVLLCNTPMPTLHLVEHIAGIWFDKDTARYPLARRDPSKASATPALVGSFFSPLKRLLTIEESEGVLVARQPGRADLPVFVDGDRLDFGIDGIGRFTIARNQHGGISGFRTDEPEEFAAEVVSYTRAVPYLPTTDELVALEGTYRSTELDITYELSVRDNQLVIDTLLGPFGIVLSPSIPDRFDGDGAGIGSIVILRDDYGRPDGFRCVAERHDNIIFRKQ